MNQPQDKMRAEFEATMRAEPYRWSRIDFDRETDFPGQSYAWVRTQAAWDAWQAACAQQSAQASQDAPAPLTDTRICDIADDYSSTYQHGGNTYDMFDHMGFARAIEAAHAIAAQGASNV